MGPRRNSTMELFQEGQDADIEYFFASDASAIIEHTNRVIYLEVRGSFKIVTGCLSPDFLTHQFVSQFSQHWYKIFKNGFLYRVSPRAYLGNSQLFSEICGLKGNTIQKSVFEYLVSVVRNLTHKFPS